MLLSVDLSATASRSIYQKTFGFGVYLDHVIELANPTIRWQRPSMSLPEALKHLCSRTSINGGIRQYPNTSLPSPLHRYI